MSRIGTYKLSPQNKWINAGSMTTTEAALGADERDCATADALTSTGIITLDLSDASIPYAVLLRFRSDGNDGDEHAIQLYVARSSGDYYHRIATLTILQGTVEHGTAPTYFTDSITPSNEDPIFDGEESTNTIANEIGDYYFRMLGFDRIFMCLSTLDTNSTTVYVDYCLLYE